MSSAFPVIVDSAEIDEVIEKVATAIKPRVRGHLIRDKGEYRLMTLLDPVRFALQF